MVSPNFMQEQLSFAYVRAVVFRSGFRLSEPVKDDHGIDGTIASYSRGMGRVDFQLKSTTRYEIRNSEIVYQLRVEDYNRLILEDDLPRILILFIMPDDDNLWLSHSADELCLRECAYWVSLMGRPLSDNKTTVQVAVPLANVFSPDGLRDLFSRLPSGEL